MSNPYEMFDQDEKLEVEGIYLEYPLFRVKVARAGGSNKRYNKVLQQKAKPYRRAIQTETLGEEIGEALMRNSFIDACVVGWDTREAAEGEGSSWKTNTMHDAEGKVVPYNIDAVKALLTKRPELYRALQEDANRAALYRKEVREGDKGNS